MRAVVVDRWMGPEELQVKEVPEPEIAPQGNHDIWTAS